MTFPFFYITTGDVSPTNMNCNEDIAAIFPEERLTFQRFQAEDGPSSG